MAMTIDPTRTVNTGTQAQSQVGSQPAAQITGSPHLISSERVEGTEVYGADGEHIGEIHHMMVEKVTGRVAYAIMSFGGFLGLGKEFFPVPWNSLKYDTTLDGYRTDITREQLEAAPEYTAENFDWADDDWHARVHEHYRTTPTYLGYM